MAWVTSVNPIHNTFASLFVQNGDNITVNEDCLAILEEILRKLSTEDCFLRTFRRAIGFGQNIKKNLMPLLLHVKDDTKIADATKIIDTTIKILVNLTIPLEYLVPIEAMSRTEVEKHTIFELSNLLTSSKEVFTESKSTKSLVDHMKYIVESDCQLNSEQCDSINNCLLLLRNILHVPETRPPASNVTLSHTHMQNQIMWNLFTQSIDKILIYLMSCPQKVYWGVTLVQLIALMYKDQHVGTLQKLLNLWLEASYSDSSEDNESNTSPPEQGSDGFSPVVTSDPTSDSSDNGGNYINKCSNNNTNNRVIMDRAQSRNKNITAIKRNKSIETETSTSSGVSSMGQSLDLNDLPPQATTIQQTHILITNRVNQATLSEVSDYGYVTQVETQEWISTSSNEDDQPLQKPIHQKPPTFQKTRYNNNKNRATTTLDKKELRRKKLVKRRKTNIINMKGLVHHLPTDEDIANILKEFTVDFLLKGYGTLVNDLYTEILSNVHVQIDTSHFFWLVTYFLKFAIQLELDPEHISPVLSQDILGYLIFQGIWIYEELEISFSIPDFDLKPCLRRLHLVVTAIREFLQGVEAYQKMIHLSDSDKDTLAKLQFQIVELKDLKMLFVLLLRQYNPNIQSRQYLQDLILTNHCFFLFLDNSCRTQEQHTSLMEHLKNFANVEIMRQYGLLLENFKENGEFVNNCIFTMMHHIGGDLNNVETLFQPTILKTFSQIWETDYEISDDWSDLIEYVIHKFINSPGAHYAENTTTPSCLENDRMVEEESKSECSSLDQILMLFRWTNEEKDNLLKYYNQSKESSDTVEKITRKYEESGFKYKSQMSVIQELLEQDIITKNEYNELLRHHRIDRKDAEPTEDISKQMEDNFHSENYLIDSDTKVIKDFLYKENKGKFLLWLQNVLLEACYVKLVLDNPEEFRNNNNIIESSIYYFAVSNLPIPLVPWTTEQSGILKYQPFVLLLHKLGFYLPVDTGKFFVRIPNFWTAEYMFRTAQLLGPIDKDRLKFDIDQMKETNNCSLFDTRSTLPISLRRFSSPDLKLTPSIVRYTPLTTQLSIAIPEIDVLSCHLTPPQLAIVSNPHTNYRQISMDYHSLHIHEKDYIEENNNCLPHHLQESELLFCDDIERNSICDTASVASDLTRMCVSDEDEKVILVLDTNKK